MAETPPYRYALALTREQVEAVNVACELLARVGMGQLRYLADHTPAVRGGVDAMLAVRDALESVEPLATLRPRNAYPGIAHSDCGVVAQRAWEVYESIRVVLSMDHRPDCPCVWHREPMTITGEPRPRCEVIE